VSERILVVDDEADVLLSLRIVLETAGYDVLEAASGEEALEVFDNEQPDLVVLDIVLPGIDGWAVLDAVRARSDTPVILASANADPGLRERAQASGAATLFTKPFGAEDLRRMVGRLLSRG
jgi:OmpR family response regulator RpaB